MYVCSLQVTSVPGALREHEEHQPLRDVAVNLLDDITDAENLDDLLKLSERYWKKAAYSTPHYSNERQRRMMESPNTPRNESELKEKISKFTRKSTSLNQLERVIETIEKLNPPKKKNNKSSKSKNNGKRYEEESCLVSGRKKDVAESVGKTTDSKVSGRTAKRNDKNASRKQQGVDKTPERKTKYDRDSTKYDGDSSETSPPGTENRKSVKNRKDDKRDESGLSVHLQCADKRCRKLASKKCSEKMCGECCTGCKFHGFFF